MAQEPASVSAVLENALDGFLGNVTGALPDLLTGVVFLVVAAVLIKVATWVVRLVLGRALGRQRIYVDLAATLTGVVLWFGALLAFLATVGLPEIAAALGTATGFLALGVSYALSGMLADAVAGLYLIRDPDFNPGDSVVAGDVTGTVQSIELRKTRFDVDGDRVVRANAEVEKKWTKRAE